MIAVTELYCSRSRPNGAQPADIPPFTVSRKPVVVWNATRTCNLNCSHCYSDARPRACPGELTTAEACAMIEDLAQFGVPALLLAGGEPLMRADLLELIAYARDRGLRLVLLTNGTLVTAAVAARLKRSGVGYVDISLKGFNPARDRFRGELGAQEAALAGIRNCAEVGQRVGIRVTLRKQNHQDLDAIFDFLEREKIGRVCFHHVVYAGRGNNPRGDDLSHPETRQALDLILRRADDLHRRGLNVEVFTGDNHVDGVYLYLKSARRDPVHAAQVYRTLARRGGGRYGAGVGIGNIDAQGNVHPDQFWSHHTLGNIRRRPFSQIWTDLSDPLMRGLRNPLPLLKGKCAKCLWKPVCGGSLRVRAEKVYGDPWMHDPACYLSQHEVSRETSGHAGTLEEDVLLEERAA